MMILLLQQLLSCESCLTRSTYTLSKKDNKKVNTNECVDRHAIRHFRDKGNRHNMLGLNEEEQEEDSVIFLPFLTWVYILLLFLQYIPCISSATGSFTRELPCISSSWKHAWNPSSGSLIFFSLWHPEWLVYRSPLLLCSSLFFSVLVSKTSKEANIAWHESLLSMMLLSSSSCLLAILCCRHAKRTWIHRIHPDFP